MWILPTVLRRMRISWFVALAGVMPLLGQSGASGPAGHLPVPRVTPIHQPFEVALENSTPYEDPYRDVALEVTVHRPGGTSFRIDGFYDEARLWRFRILPDTAGQWSYVAKFSDGSLRRDGSFHVSVQPSSMTMVAVHRRNPIWFGRVTGDPLLIRGFHAGDRFFAENWPAADRARFLDWCAASGYNFLSVASHYLNRDEADRGRGWKTPQLWPLNAAEFRKMEAILDDALRRGIVVWPFAGFFGKNSHYPRDPGDQERYVRYTVARLAAYPHILWNVAGPEPNLRDKQEWMSSAEVTRLGRLIRSLDPHHHPISVHNRTGDDPYRDSDWTTYGVLQGPKTNDPAVLSAGLLANHHPAKPLLAQETLWSRNTFHTRALGRDYTDDEVRQNAWILEMSAASLVFADNDGNSSTGFTGTLDPADAHPTRHQILKRVWDFMESVPFSAMRPRQDLVDRGYCLAEPGQAWLVYLPQGGSVTPRLGSRDLALRAEWVDPRDPTKRRAASPIGDRFLAPDGQDWLLHLLP